MRVSPGAGFIWSILFLISFFSDTGVVEGVRKERLMTDEEREIVENLDVLEIYEILRDMDFLDNYEVIEGDGKPEVYRNSNR